MAYTISQPAFEPVTLAEAKEWLKVSGTEEDDSITLLISAAREFGETMTSRFWAARTVTEYFDTWPDGPFLLTVPGVSAVSSVAYLPDGSATYTVLPDTNYYVDKASTPARVVFDSAASLPNLDEAPNAVRVIYAAGASTSADIAASNKTGMRLLIAFWYENREDIGLPATERSARQVFFADKNYANF